MYITPQDSPLDIYQPLTSPASDGGGDVFTATANTGPAGNAQDAISRFVPPWGGSQDGLATYQPNAQSSLFGMVSNLIAQLGQLLQQMGGQLGFGSTAGSPPAAGATCGGRAFGGPQQFFQSASGSSVGDPHLSFNGRHWNDMQSQSNLIDSNSFDGGYGVSTQTTTPNDSGVTYNQSATVTTENGSAQVSLDNQGNATISQFGRQFALSDGQNVSLGNGENVSRSTDGAVTISDTNGWGGAISTTLAGKGRGVDVSVQANNVDLGGSLVNGGNASPQTWQPPQVPQPAPVGIPVEPWRRYAQPAL